MSEAGMMTFKYITENGLTLTTSLPNSTTLPDILEYFRLFLLTAGYPVEGALELSGGKD